MRQLTTKIIACACALVLGVGMLIGCTGPSGKADEAQQKNQAYMSQVNGVMADLGDKLESFVSAVSRGDIVNMRTQADDAYKALDKLSSLEVPENLKDVQQKYVDGTAKLREALDGYIALFTDVQSESFDQSTYADRLAKVQSLYDEGVDLLKQADETAAGK